MRDLNNVIEQLLEVIPPEEIVLQDALKGYRSSVEFAAPEMIGFWWREVGNCLGKQVGATDKAWKKSVHKIYCGS